MKGTYLFGILTFAFATIITATVYAQEEGGEDDETAVDMLIREVEVENPVYMPVVGLGAGYFNFHGDIKDAYRSFTVGKPAMRVNVTTYIGKKHQLRGNLVFMTGDIFGTQRTVPQELISGDVWNPAASQNLNFKSTIFSFGFNFHYSFKPLLKGKYLEPFVSLGIETMSFNSKADYLDNAGNPYHYWTDGTIRSVDEITGDPGDQYLTQRDYSYETDLRSIAKRSGLGRYSTFSFTMPVDAGFDFNISDRVSLRAATSLHYAFTDLFDDLTSKSTNEDYRGKKGNDWFTFSYLSLHLDLFSSDKVKIVEDLFADVEDYDMAMYDDEDNDGVFDGWDECPGTPSGVPVDSIGCPFDKDVDGVPDYLDREVSRAGAIVDEFGVEINENTIVELLGQPALNRRDVAAFLSRNQENIRVRGALPIPDKFKKLDANNDGEISFDELLKTINTYFDGTSDYSPLEIRELNNFFFDQ
ncbi:MAG: hypothetical protein LBR08_11805 [Bacteroidales bacterium]|nr:hypothetical protein [Bacteroidales bacterium]